MEKSEPLDTWQEIASIVDRLLDTPPSERARVIDDLSAGDPVRRARLERWAAQCEGEDSLLNGSALERFAGLFEPAVFPGDAPRTVSHRPRHRAWRNGDGVSRARREACARRRGEDRAIRTSRDCLGPSVSCARSTLWRGCGIRTSCRCTTRATPTACCTTSCRTRRDARCASGSCSTGRLAPDEVVQLLREICDALAYAHSCGIVHRDIKPDNVLLSGRHALITDFGIAKAVSDASLSTSTGAAAAPARFPATAAAIGTPAYMAPEQIEGDSQIDARSDIYALGVLAYELLSGAPPFVADTREAVLAAHVREQPLSLAARSPDVPPALASIVMRCLEKKRDDRWQSVPELLQQLEQLGVPSPAPRVAVVPSRRRALAGVLAAGTVVAVAAATLLSRTVWSSERAWQGRWARVHLEKLTDFPGAEVDAVMSADGRRAAFLADRDGTFDAYVTRIGSGSFVNLTRGRFHQLYNEDVQNIGFAPGGANVWLRVADLTAPASVAVVPDTGGETRPFLPTAVTVAWSADRSRLAYHETTPGDPIFVADSDGRNPRRIFISPPGLHSHFLTWSADGRFLYFTHGLPPDEMDVWRISAQGGSPERITHHDSRVQSPVLLDDRTLVYTATDADGSGPWLYTTDVERRVSTRVSLGVEQFLSIAASAPAPGGPRRLVAAVSNPRTRLWSVPLSGSKDADTSLTEEHATELPLPTARAAAPRYAADSTLYYLASRGGSDALWQLSAGGVARELWRPRVGAIVGAAAVSPDGRTICVIVRNAAARRLHCIDADGRHERMVAPLLDARDSPSWSPDGHWIAMAARDGSAFRVFKIPMAGGSPVRLGDAVASNPVWSPDGSFILYSGTPSGRSAPLLAMRADGTPIHLAISGLLVDRLGDDYRFTPDGRALVVKLGGFRLQDFWLIDPRTGDRRRLTRLRPGESVSRFDVSRDGRRVVFERVEENSDIALLELPAR